MTYLLKYSSLIDIDSEDKSEACTSSNIFFLAARLARLQLDTVQRIVDYMIEGMVVSCYFVHHW